MLIAAINGIQNPLITLAQSEQSNPMSQMLILFALILGMWFLFLAPQRKRQKEHQALIDNLKTGDKVVTSSGIYGMITNVKPDRYVLKIADNTKVEIVKSFIQAKVQDKSEDED